MGIVYLVVWVIIQGSCMPVVDDDLNAALLAKATVGLPTWVYATILTYYLAGRGHFR